jgi:D-alanyl-D-alanine carboxypeptidase
MVATARVEDDPDNTLSRRARRAIAAFSPVGRAEAASSRHLHKGSGRWSIQIGAFSEEAAAERAGSAALARLPGGKHKAMQVIAPGPSDAESYYRTRIVSFSEREAQKACRTLHRKHVQCAVIAPGSTQQASTN